jgi:hypothetical protein
VIESYQRAERIAAASRGITAHEGGMAAAVVAALDKGRDVATDAVVRSVVAAQLGVGNLASGITAHVGAEMREVFIAHADEIVKAWRGPFDTAANTLTDAYRKLGDVALDDGTTILRRGGDVAETWAAAIKAVGTVTTIEGAWVQLCQLTGAASVDRRYMAFRLADVDPRTYAELALMGPLDPWRATCLGITLSLPTVSEYRARVANLLAVAEAEVAAERDAERTRFAGSAKSR